jgi:uncharacterized protein YyaL (SSP411 family)
MRFLDRNTLSVPLLVALLSLCGRVPPLAAEPLTNRLQGHPSAYLAMHGDDPVHWQAWGGEALERARIENKPLFVSSGYFACHWCHVMQRESYRDRAVAALLNTHFIPVKVDRELEPALDAYLIGFVEETQGNAGWPLNVFITPEGYPLMGFTYLPRDSFHRLLVRFAGAWGTDGDRLAAMARDAAGQVEAPQPVEALPADPAPLLERLAAQALELADEMQGGFGHQSRFPMAPQLAALLELEARRPQQRLEKFLRLTLDQMAGQGMHDLLAGGFFRYTVDPDWQVPHFEKMLYDQALLVVLHLRAAEVLERPAYRLTARRTLDFALEHMSNPDGGFSASLSALDDQGVEGGAYLWSRAQLDALLQGSEHALAGLVWGLAGSPNNEGGYLPVQRRALDTAAGELGLAPQQASAALGRAQAKLLLGRASRGLPRDAKPVAAWNGLMLSALAAGVRSFGDLYKAPGEALRDFLVQRLWDGRELHRSRGPDGWLGEAALEDHADVARGLADWAAVTGSAQTRTLALTLVRRAWALYFDRGWRTARRLLPGLPADAALPDSPLPSPSATLIRLTLELADPSQDQDLLGQARLALRLGYPVAEELPFGYAGTVLALAAGRQAAGTGTGH